MRAIDELKLETALEGLPEAAADMRLVGLVADNDGINKADLLLRQETAEVASESVQAVWVEIQIPEGARSGLYAGEVRVYRHSLFEDGQKIRALPFRIAVKDVRMPDPHDYAFHLDLWQHPSNIARMHEVERWSEANFQVLDAISGPYPYSNRRRPPSSLRKFPGWVRAATGGRTIFPTCMNATWSGLCEPRRGHMHTTFWPWSAILPCASGMASTEK